MKIMWNDAKITGYVTSVTWAGSAKLYSTQDIRMIKKRNLSELLPKEKENLKWVSYSIQQLTA